MLGPWSDDAVQAPLGRGGPTTMQPYGSRVSLSCRNVAQCLMSLESHFDTFVPFLLFLSLPCRPSLFHHQPNNSYQSITLIIISLINRDFESLLVDASKIIERRQREGFTISEDFMDRMKRNQNLFISAEVVSSFGGLENFCIAISRTSIIILGRTR
ncbi:hypothetical protein QN277_026429 [Acacia crassicarpa]|uniref:Uncharacterized protein n=1 Tax=Acacia crassicarpa TaxID=499986 RepID=A0AAE1K4G3_9FABA|nr:hypothetical protein QN277_026429 [Acacia crassicarpa]